MQLLMNIFGEDLPSSSVWELSTPSCLPSRLPAELTAEHQTVAADMTTLLVRKKVHLFLLSVRALEAVGLDVECIM